MVFPKPVLVSDDVFASFTAMEGRERERERGEINYVVSYLKSHIYLFLTQRCILSTVMLKCASFYKTMVRVLAAGFLMCLNSPIKSWQLHGTLRKLSLYFYWSVDPLD